MIPGDEWVLVVLETKTGIKFAGWMTRNKASEFKQDVKERGLRIDDDPQVPEHLRNKCFKIVKAWSPDQPEAYLKKHPEVIFPYWLSLRPPRLEWWLATGDTPPSEVLPENWL